MRNKFFLRLIASFVVFNMILGCAYLTPSRLNNLVNSFVSTTPADSLNTGLSEEGVIDPDDKDDKLDTTSNLTCKEPSKSFHLNSISKTKKPNEALRIKILQKSDNTPIKISNKYKFPSDHVANFNGFKATPSVIKTIYNPPLDKETLKRNKKKMMESIKEYLKEKYKKDLKDLKHRQKEARILKMFEFRELIKTFKKESEERKNFIKEQIELREEIISEQLDEREDLKKVFKKELEELKSFLNNKPFKDDKKFNTKACITCDPFSEINYENFNDGSVGFNTIDNANSFETDGTFTDGLPFDDSTQEQPPVIRDYLGMDYELSDSDVERLEKLGIQGEGCTGAGKMIMEQSGNIVTFRYETLPEGCTIAKTEIIYKVSATSCGQGTEIKIETPSNKSFGIKAQIPFGPLGIPTKADVFLRMTALNGNIFETKVGTIGEGNAFKTLAENERIKSGDIKLAKDNLDLGYFTKNGTLPTSEATINTLKEKGDVHTIFIEKNDKAGLYNFRIKNSLGDLVCSSGCASSTGTTITINKKILDNDEYKLEIVDGHDDINTGTAVDTLTFVNTKVATTTFFTQGNYVEKSEFSYLPTTSGKFVPYKTILEPVAPSTSYEKPNLNLNFDPTQSAQCRAVPLIKDIAVSNSNEGKIVSEILKDGSSSFTENSVSSCGNNPIMVGAIVDLTNKVSFTSSTNDINGKLREKNKLALLSLTIEDSECNVLQSWNFVAKLGTKHIITRKFIPYDIGASCYDKVFYVKVKKLIPQNLSFSFDNNQQTYANNVSLISISQQQAGAIDVVPYVENIQTGNANNGTGYEGTKGKLLKCLASSKNPPIDVLCNKDYSSARNKIKNALNNNPFLDPVTDTNSPFIEGNNDVQENDSFDVFSNATEIAKIGYVIGGSAGLLFAPTLFPLTPELSEDAFRTTLKTDSAIVSSISIAEKDMYKTLTKYSYPNNTPTNLGNVKKYTNNIITELDWLSQYPHSIPKAPLTADIQTSTTSSNNVFAKNINLKDNLILLNNAEKSFVNEVVNTTSVINSNKISATSFSSIFRYLSNSAIVSLQVTEGLTDLYNLKNAANQDYINSLKKVIDTTKNITKRLDETKKDPCKNKKSRLVLERAMLYLSHHIIKRLVNEPNLEVSIFDTTYNLELSKVGKIADEVQSNLDKIYDTTKDECNECKDYDFDPFKKDYFIRMSFDSKRTISCRVCNTNKSLLRSPLEQDYMRNGLYFINNYRNDSEKIISNNPPGEAGNSDRVFAYGIIKNKDNQELEKVKAVSSRQDLVSAGFLAPIIDSERIYDKDALVINFSDSISNRSNDAEVVIMEYIAKNYKDKYQNEIINVDVFSDRETCYSCVNNLFEKEVLNKTPNIKVKYLPYGIYKAGEKIPTLGTIKPAVNSGTSSYSSNFYSGIICK
ncbi:MAG: deaminase domain-containing protein [Candidatus Sericytochromatia bacterium]